MMTTL